MQTDNKLITVIHSGRLLLECIDPDALLGEGTVRRVVYRTDRDFAWFATVVFPTGDELFIAGQLRDGAPLITSLRLHSGKDAEEITVKASEVLSDALGELSGVPLPLKRNLATGGRKRAVPKESTILSEGVRRIVASAVGWRVDGMRQDEISFNVCELEYTASQGGEPYSVLVSMKATLEGSQFTAQTAADIYGLGRKSVTLVRNMGEDGTFRADCRRTVDGHQTPSLAVALMLHHALADRKPKQKKKKVKIKAG